MPALIHVPIIFSNLTIVSCHTKDSIEKVSAIKGYSEQSNRAFLLLNRILSSDSTVSNNLTFFGV